MKGDKRLLKKIDDLMCDYQDQEWKVPIAVDLDCLLVEAENTTENPGGAYGRKLAKAIINIVERVKNFEGIK
jgi:hypothetical protein